MPPHSSNPGSNSELDEDSVLSETSEISEHSDIDESYKPSYYKSTKHRAPIKTRALNRAQPNITSATELLLTTKAGINIFTDATVFTENLFIGRSQIVGNAGNGLYIVAKTNDLFIKKGHIITWFNGEIVFLDKHAVTSAETQQYTIGLGSSIKTASQVIISRPDDHNLFGCAHLANHSTSPNSKLKYLQGENGVNGVLLITNRAIHLKRGEALEMVFDYNTSAVNVHHIFSPYAYQPVPILFSQIIEAPKINFLADPSSLSKAEDDTIKNMDGCARFSHTPVDPDDEKMGIFLGEAAYNYGDPMPKRRNKEKTLEQMTSLVSEFLSSSSFQIATAMDLSFFKDLLTKSARYFFVQITPELDEHYWIFIYHDARAKKLYIFDPQGLPLTKFSPAWLSTAALGATEICICHSWFVYATHPKAPEYQQTGTICIELARVIATGLNISASEFPFPAKDDWTTMGGKISHFNLILPSSAPDLKALGTLFVSYPNKISCETSDREAAITEILSRQHCAIKEDGAFHPSFFPTAPGSKEKSSSARSKRPASTLEVSSKQPHLLEAKISSEKLMDSEPNSRHSPSLTNHPAPTKASGNSSSFSVLAEAYYNMVFKDPPNVEPWLALFPSTLMVLSEDEALQTIHAIVNGTSDADAAEDSSNSLSI